MKSLCLYHYVTEEYLEIFSEPSVILAIKSGEKNLFTTKTSRHLRLPVVAKVSLFDKIENYLMAQCFDLLYDLMEVLI